MTAVRLDVGVLRAVVFDLDGVLTDTARLHAAAWKEMFDRYLAGRRFRGVDVPRPFNEDDYDELVDGRPRLEGVATFLGSRGIVLEAGSPEDPPYTASLWGLGHAKDVAFRRLLDEAGVEILPGAAELIVQLRDAHVLVGVVSASRNCRTVLRAAGLDRQFDVTVDGVEAATLGLPGKPDPATFLEAASRLGVDPARSALFEDSLAGVVAGRRAGFGLVAAVADESRAPELGRAGADEIVPDLRSVRVVEPPCADRDARFEAIVVTGRPDDERGGPSRASTDLLPSFPVLFAGSRTELRARLVELWNRGIAPASVLIAGPDEPLEDLVARQLRHRAEGALPAVDSIPGWCLQVDGDPAAGGERILAGLLTLSNGTVGVRGDLEDRGDGSTRLVLVAGAYGTGADGLVRPLPAPVFTDLGASDDPRACRRVLDLHSGILERRGAPSGLRSVRIVSVTDPTVAALRAEDDRPADAWPVPLGPPPPSALAAEHTFIGPAGDGPTWTAETVGDRGSVTAAASQRVWALGAGTRMERIVSYAAHHPPSEATCIAPDASRSHAFDQLLTAHRSEWARRWSLADIEIRGDPRSQLAVRHALFHLLSCAATVDEATVGARGLTGLAYAGHVFWDTDVFVLPALAATIPDAARAVLQYRVNRLPAARRRAIALRLPGARFPWESADSGEEATPVSTRDTEGRIVPIRTGDHAEHINADIAWAALHYVDWTGDRAFVEGPGRALVVDTARYWQGRVRRDPAGRGHLYGVVGPDEYHEVVDDNAFTNGMARWHLQQAATLLREDGELREAELLDDTAASLVTGHDATTGRHEQHAGYWALDDLLIGDVAEPPVAADVLLGRAAVRRSQVIKQPDVLMLHHLLPDQVPPGSLAADLEHAVPRTAHGSSLSPAIVAALLARAGRPDDAMPLFDMAARLDLDDLTGTTAAGLHLATMGGVWQAIVRGFAGIRPTREGLRIDPHLPRRWDSLCIRLSFRGVALQITIDHEHLLVDSDEPVPLVIEGEITSSPLRHPRAPDEKER